ncbi:MAG: hypothetical protein E5Y03_25015 [Mesorhizobium sp.]|uniref:hypothetical protein n=1 Tax=Mesorhizobium sp. TaxID=1871066 RepID=UPI001208575C|nr:hypothetical protein [Mesorhizobium sp.]TIN98292.1 MAG: hypothetical protein E5Y03_25015 [Mesorhizobium sp.]
MPIRRKVAKRRDGMPVEKLQRIWGFWARQNFCQLTGLHPPEEIAKARLSEAEEAELGRLHEECEAAGYDPLLAWC